MKYTKAALALATATLAGCGTVRHDVAEVESHATEKFAHHQARQDQEAPVVTRTKAAWLLGDVVAVVHTPSPLLDKKVVYAPGRPVPMADLVAYLTQASGLRIDISELSSTTSPSQPSEASALPPNLPGAATAIRVPSLSGLAGGMPSQPTQQHYTFDYEGKLSGLLDIAAARLGVWWKYVDGRGVVFFRTESRTFYLPAHANKSDGSSQITANTTNSSSGSTSSASTGSGNGSGSSAMAGGTNSTSSFVVDLWADLEKTATVVGAGARVAVNPTAGSVTVTGSPTQIRHVEEWVKGLTDNLSQQVMITLDVYAVKLSAEDNYNWDPSLVFKSLSGTYGFNFSGPQSPAASISPMSVTAGVLNSATGSAAKYSGSEVAAKALSTMGKVVQTIHQTAITLNGKPAPMQLADVRGYLASSALSGVGSTTGSVTSTLTPGTLTTGLTVMFLPKVVNGKIFLEMHLTSSSNNGFGVQQSGGSMLQTPSYSLNNFQHSAMLTPGDSMLLTGIQHNNHKSDQSGVGSANNYLAGGGVGASTDKQLTAIVVSAKVL